MIESNFRSISVRRIAISGEEELRVEGRENLDLGGEGVPTELPSNLETQMSSISTYPILKRL